MTVTRRAHHVAVVAAGKQIDGWISYTITSSILDPVDTFTLTLPWARKVYDLVKADSPIKITIDGVVVLNGFIDDRETPAEDDTIVITGRDRCGRLIQESAPGVTWRGLNLVQLVEKLVYPWFTRVTISNARNRNILRGKGRKARVGSEPLLVAPRKDGLLAEPGQMRWSIIEDLLKQAGLLAWSAGDGTELVLGKPNYDQEPQWRFFRPAPGSKRMAEGNVSIGIKESVGDRYSRVVVVGAGAGTDSNFGPVLVSRYGEAKDNPATADGTGRAFSSPKVLVLQESVSSIDEARAIARRELLQRAAKGEAETVMAPAHGQLVGGVRPTLFCPDTIGYLECERTGKRGAYLVTACRYECDRESGQRTTLDLVPEGTELAP